MSKREEYEELLAGELRDELDRRKIEVEPGSGSGKDGRVVKSDLVDTLVADDERVGEVVEDEAGDAVEPAEKASPEDELGPHWPDHQAFNAIHQKEAATATGGVQIGDVVTYRDKFSGAAQDARVSGIVDAVEGVVDLAVFSGGGGARRREAVPRGRTSGTWEPKEVA